VTLFGARIVAGIASATGVVVLAIVPFFGSGLTSWAARSAEYRERIAPAPMIERAKTASVPDRVP
jgi:hypothetical protein